MKGLSRKLRDVYWGVKNCDKCSEGEKVYFCEDCGRFYCSHCLIPNNGGLVCPSGRDHKLIDVIEFGQGLGKRLMDKLRMLGGKLELTLEMLDSFSEIGEKINEAITHRIYIDKELFDETLNKIRELETSINELDMAIKNAYSSIRNNIMHSFRRFGEGDIEGALLAIDNSDINEMITNLDCNELRKFLESLDKEVKNSLKMHEIVKGSIVNYLEDNEWLVSIIHSSESKKIYRVIITDKRLIAIKGASILQEIKLSNISQIEHKVSIRFKGLVIKHQGGQIKIPCEGYDCYKIRINIEKASLVNNSEKIDKTSLEQLIKSLKTLKSVALNVNESYKALELEVMEMANRALKRFLTRFYYTNGGSNFTRGILDLIKKKSVNSLKKPNMSESDIESGVNKLPVADFPYTPRRGSTNVVLNRLKNLKKEVEKKLERGDITPDLIQIYYEIRNIVNMLEGNEFLE